MSPNLSVEKLADEQIEQPQVQTDGVSPEDNNRVLHKVDMFVLPVFCAVVTFTFLDKTALANTSVMGLLKQTHLVGNQYAWLGSIFSLGLLTGQYPMCYLQQKFPLAKMTGTAVVLWGVAVGCMGACQNWSQLMACRFLLGFFESALQPALVLFMAQWYRKREQGSRIGIWWSFVTWGGILGAGVSYALHNRDVAGTNKIAGWRVLFLFLGAATVFLGVVFLIAVPDKPSKAWFLNARECDIARRRTAANMDTLFTTKWKWDQAREALTDPAALLFCLVGFLCNVCNGGIISFYGIMVTGMGFSVANSFLLSMANSWVAILTIVMMYYSDKLRCRTLICAAPHLISMAGAIMVYKLPDSQPNARLAGFFLTLPFGAAATGCLSMITSNVTGRTKKTMVSVMYFVMGCTGNLVGPQTFRHQDAPRYNPALITCVACNIVIMAAMVALYFYYKRENARRDRLGETTADDELAETDVTDRMNMRFRYVL